MPFCEPITYFSRVSGDTYQGYAVSKARPRRLSKKELSLAPEILQKAEKTFELYRNILEISGPAVPVAVGTAGSCPAPKVDDYLTDQNGVSWTVLDVAGSLNDHCFNCICCKRV